MKSIKRITPEQLSRRLQAVPGPLLFDTRRTEVFGPRPMGIRTAVAIHLTQTLQVPDVELITEIVVYCLCGGQASSTRVAIWLEQAGFRNVSVLEGGLPAWRAAGYPMHELLPPGDVGLTWRSLQQTLDDRDSQAHRQLAERAFAGHEALPIKRDMAVLFIDMVESTRLLNAYTPEEVLRLVQMFMKVVVDTAVQHCGDVHDFEGDGAMLYFAGPGEAVPAAFNLRRALNAQRVLEPRLPQARLALDFGPLVMGYIGTRERRSLSFIGPSVNIAARIMKLAPPGGIVATERVIDHAKRSDPDLAAQFETSEVQVLKGIDKPVAVFLARETDAVAEGLR